MSFENFGLTKSWTNKEDFPTYESEETKVREDMQCLFTELEVGLQSLIAALNNITDGSSGASNVGVSEFSDGGINYDFGNVQAAIVQLLAIAKDAQAGQIQDGSITTAKLAGGNGEPGAVTGEKTNFSGGVSLGGTGGPVEIKGRIKLTGSVTPGGVGYDYGEELPDANLFVGRLYFKKLPE